MARASILALKMDPGGPEYFMDESTRKQTEM